MIQQFLTEDEINLIEILRHPIWCSEFIRNIDLDPNEIEKLFIHVDYQQEMLCDFNSYVSLCCGRSIGKSEVILSTLLWLSMNKFYSEVVVLTVPSKVHLMPLFLRLSRWYRHNNFLRNFIDNNSINSADFTIKLKNDFVLDCRIAGKTKTGVNVIALHVPFIFVDESGYYPHPTYLELLPVLNTFQKGHRLFISGVPDGRRERSVCFIADQIDKNFTHHRISAHRNPRYTVDDEERNLKQYGGKHSENYRHLVLGEHGQPAYSMFDRSLMAVEQYEIFHPIIKGAQFRDNPSFIYEFLAMHPKLPLYYENIVIGVDLGYTEPTVISILYSIKGHWYFLSRTTLLQVDYPIQEKLISLLNNKYNPVAIGIDMGSAGKSTVQHLITEEQYSHLKDKVVGIEFGGKTAVGIDEEEKEVQVRTKQFGMQRLQSMANSREIVFSSEDEDMIGELERTTYVRTPAGEMRFNVESLTGAEGRGDDHNTAALVCAVLAIYQKFEMNFNRKTRLYSKPFWF